MQSAEALSAPRGAAPSPLDFVRDAQVPSSDTAATIQRAEAAAVYDPPADELAGLRTRTRGLVSGEPAGGLADFHVDAALYTRKGDPARAAALLRAFAAWRARMGDGNPHSCAAVAGVLQSELIASLGTRDRDGRALVWLRLRMLDSGTYTPLDIVRTAAFVLEWTVRTYPWARSHGISFLHDARGLRLGQMDTRIAREMRAAFAQTLPVRVARLTVLSPPRLLNWMIRAVMALLGSKLKARIQVLHRAAELAEIAGPSAVPESIGLGGTLSWTSEDHAAWVDHVIEDCKSWPGIDLSPVDGQVAAAALATQSVSD